MVSKWDLAATHGLRKYIWQLLQTELGWNASNYGGLTPLVTPEQQPELNAFNAPYIVYSFGKSPNGSLWQIEREIAVFTIFSASAAEINQVVNLLTTKLNKMDESARDVNDYLSASLDLDPFYRKFDFKTVSVMGAQGPQAVTTEGGRRDGYITVAIEYTLYDSNGQSVRI